MKKTALIFLLVISCSYFSFSQINIQKEDLVGEWFSHLATFSNSFVLCQDMERIRGAGVAMSIEFKADGLLLKKSFAPLETEGWCGTEPLAEPISQTLTLAGTPREGTWAMLENDIIVIKFDSHEIKWQVANILRDPNTGTSNANQKSAIIQIIPLE